MNKETDMNKVETRILSWARERGILEHGKPYSQLLKAVSEMGELCDAEGKQDIDAIKDAIGDVMVCLINYAALRGTNLSECLNLAYDSIKDRKGKLMPDGTFVKEE
jgi:NTP pyrophosphatase (non-canonical NTP hydrolase)